MWPEKTVKVMTAAETREGVTKARTSASGRLFWDYLSQSLRQWEFSLPSSRCIGAGIVTSVLLQDGKFAG